MIAEGVDHAGLMRSDLPAPGLCRGRRARLLSDRGHALDVSRSGGVYRRFGHADRIAMTEGYHGHAFSVENQAAAIAFLDRFNGLPARRDLPPTAELDDRTLQVTTHGTGACWTIRMAGRCLDEIRDYYRARAHQPRPTLSRLYYGRRLSRHQPMACRRLTGLGRLCHEIQWEAAGSSTVDDMSIDKYVLHHSGGLQMPLLHISSSGHRWRPGVAVGRRQRQGRRAATGTRVRNYIADGYDVISFDCRGLGETRMRYTAVSVDDPSLAINDFDRAYVNPLSSVLADYVYNVTPDRSPLPAADDRRYRDRGAIRARSPRMRPAISIAAEGDAYTLAHWAANVLPGIHLCQRR